MSTTTITTDQALTRIWDYLYGHDTECPEYVPGKRLLEEDTCGCTYEWDSATIEVVADMVRDALPPGFLRHRAQVTTVLLGQYGRHQVVRYVAGCMCGWTARDKHDTESAALFEAMQQHLDLIPIRLHV